MVVVMVAMMVVMVVMVVVMVMLVAVVAVLAVVSNGLRPIPPPCRASGLEDCDQSGMGLSIRSSPARLVWSIGCSLGAISGHLGRPDRFGPRARARARTPRKWIWRRPSASPKGDNGFWKRKETSPEHLRLKGWWHSMSCFGSPRCRTSADGFSAERKTGARGGEGGWGGGGGGGGKVDGDAGGGGRRRMGM